MFAFSRPSIRRPNAQPAGRGWSRRAFPYRTDSRAARLSAARRPAARGFAILPGDEEVDGLTATVDRGPQEDHRVHFELILDQEVDT